MLIINADDFGLTKGINKGIVKGFSQGIITSATALVNMPCWVHAADLVSKYPCLGIGLQFNISQGDPVCNPEEIPSLVEDGTFAGSSECISAADSADVARELSSQYQRLLVSGVKPTHIGSHQNIHSLSNVLPVILDFAGRVGLPVRLISQARKLYLSAGTATTGELIVDFWDRGANRPNFERLLLDCNSDSVELQCHPGIMDAELEGLSPYTWQRERELAVVCAYDKEDFSQRFGYQLVPYSVLKAAH